MEDKEKVTVAEPTPKVLRKKKVVEKKWYVIYTKPRAEKKVFDRLLDVGVETYLPLYTTIRKWSDRKKKVEVPLFNSYIFVKILAKDYLKVLEVVGVVRFIYYVQKLAVVRQKEIDAIKRFLNKTEGLKIKVEKGDRVEIATGPMEGVYGKVIRIGKNKLVLQIEQLNMSLVAEVEKAQVRKPLKKEK